MSKNIDLSIIIVSHNTASLLQQCLASCVKSFSSDNNIRAEIIVIDNASTDVSADITKKFNVTLIKNKKNVGFGVANNQGASVAKGTYLLFLNSDTIVNDDALSRMVCFMDEHQKTGIASCQLLNTDGTIQSQGGSLPNLLTVVIWAFFFDDVPILHEILPSYQLRRTSFFSGKPKKTGWVGGTAMWVRRSAWNQLGGFDASIFMYGEDVDICYRASCRGWNVFVNPEVSVVHIGQGSSKGSMHWVVGETEGLKKLCAKYRSIPEAFLIRIIVKIGMWARWLIFGILKRNEALTCAYWQAFRVA